MKKTAILLVSTLMLGVSASAMADSNRWNNHHDHKDRYDHRYDRHDHREARWSNGDRGNHYGQRINLKRGERLPSNSVVNVMWFQTIAIIVYISHHVVITGCKYKENMYSWIQNIVFIESHNLMNLKQP